MAYQRTFNRNIVECKVGKRKLPRLKNRRLIETLWNVKYWNVKLKQYCFKGLIETLWNVKAGRLRLFWGLSRFNRNIVECKGIS